MMQPEAATDSGTPVSDSSRQVRDRALNRIQSLVDGDVAGFYDVAYVDGRPHFHDTQVLTDDDSVRNEWYEVGGSGVLMPAGSAFAPRCKLSDGFYRGNRTGVAIPPNRRNRFRTLRDEVNTEVAQHVPLYRKLYASRDGDQLRALMFRGSEFLGWLGVARYGGRPFTSAEKRRLNREVETLAGELVCARSIREGLEDLNGAHLLLDANTLSCSLATPRISGWLTDPRLDLVRSATRLWLGGDGPGRASIEGALLRFDVIEGPLGRFVVIVFDIPSTVHLVGAAQLSDAEYEVAELATLGATNAEIAKALERSPNTVKRQLAHIYAKLDVGSRVELAKALYQKV